MRISNIKFKISHVVNKVRKARRRLVAFALIVIVIGIPFVMYSITHVRSSQAAWFNDNWAYRAAINISAHTAVETNVYLNLTGADDLDTSDTTKFQTDCGDLRFTDQAGNLLPYYIVSGCGSASTVVHVFLKTFPAGPQTFYYYYGNPSAPNGFNSADFATAATGVTFGTVGSEEKAPSPIAYWKFDDGTGTTANDSSSNNKTGTLVGTPSWVQENLCVSGKCLEFDGNPTNNDRVYAVNPMPTGDFTYSAWIRINSYADPNGTTIFSAESSAASGDTDEFLIAADDGSNKLMVSLNASFVIFANDVITLNKWQFITVTRSGSDVTAYVDGEVVGTGTDGTALTFESTCNLYIGIDPQTGCDESGNTFASEFDGFIDEPKVYNFALSAAQIKANYDSRGSSSAGAVLGASTDNDMAALSNGLVAYYRMDETSGNASDSSGNGNTATNNSTVGFSAGKFANAGNFVTASTDSFSAADSSSLDLTSSGSLTAWINMSTASQWNGIIAKGTSNGCASTTKYQMEVSNGNLLQGCVGGDEYFSTSTVTANTWYHVAFVWDGSNVYFYINGVLDKKTPQLNPIATDNGTLNIGDSLGADYFAGDIDEVRVYNRALTGNDVANLFNWAPGPVGYWNYENGTGSTVSDLSTNGNSGTWAGTLGGQWVPGKYGKGGKFNGSNNQVSVSSTSLFSSIPGTWEGWFKTSATPPDQMSFMNRSNGAGSSDNGIQMIITSQGKLIGNIKGSGQNIDAESAASVNDGKWHHFAFVFNTGNATTNYLYLDGVLVDTTTNTQSWFFGAHPLLMGNSDDPFWDEYNGQLDEIKVYNYARTPGQITQDMNAGHPPVGSPVSSPLGYWKFDDGYGNVASNSGSLGGAANVGLYNMASPATTGSGWSQDGKIKKALSFDGVNDYAFKTISSFPAANLSQSISFWMKAPSTPGGVQTMLQLTDAAGASAVGVGTRGTGNFDVWKAGGTVLVSTPFPSTNTWHHIEYTYDGTTHRIYIDGKLKNSDTVAADTGTPTVLYFSSDRSIDEFFLGQLDEIKIYNYGLTTAQVLVDYNQGKNLVLGALSDTSQLTGGSVASNSASAEYCVPGSSDTCTAPVGRWTFEEGTGTTVNDTSGNGRSLTWAGTLGNQWKPGKIGKAGNYNNTNNCAQNTAVSGLPTGDFTYSGWYYLDTPAGAIKNLFDTSTSADGDVFQLFVDSAQRVVLWLNDAERAATASDSFVAGKWNYVAATRSGSAVTIYINGQVATTATYGTALSSQTKLYVGCFAGNNDWWDGRIDEARMYDYARSQAQIAWDYNQGKPVAYWKLDQCQGTSISDSSGNNYTGTFNISGAGSQTVVGTCNTPTDGTGAWYNGRVGKYNSSMSFDGNDEYIEVTGLLGEPKSISLSAWVNLVSKDTNGAQVISLGDAVAIDASNSEGGGGCVTGKPNGFFYTGVSHVNLCGNTDIAGTGWHHIAYTFKNNVATNNEQRLYVDGILVASGNNDNAIDYTTLGGTNTFIGKHGDGGTVYDFNGRIDDARVYNYTLTPAQVKIIYNQGAAVRFGPLTGAP